MGDGVSRAAGASARRPRRAARCAATAGVAAALSLTAFIPAAPAAPPGNDAFAAAQVIQGASGSVGGTNVEATEEAGEPDHVGEPGGRSVWYRWTAPSSGQVLFETCGSGFDTLLAVYTGTSLAGLTRVAANDDSCGVQSMVLFAATAGTVYSIAVDGFEAETGPFALRWGPVTTPANDAFASAQPITGARGTVQGSILGAGTELGERVHAGISTGASVWYSWTAPTGGAAAFNTCASDFDTVLAVYTGSSVGALTTVAANDDACQLQSRVRFRAQAGTTYRIVVDSADESRAPFTLSWNVARPPPNDDYRAARRIRGASGSVNATNEGALAEPGERAHAGVPASASMWYRWRAPATMGVQFETCRGSTFDTVLGVYRGPRLRGAARVDENEDACPGGRSRLAFPARRGVEYRLVVDGYRGDAGTFTLRWRRVSPSARLCRVPDIRGMRIARARNTLERADCVLGRVVFARSAIVPRGRIISQFPRPGVRIGMFAGVNVEVSRGRP